MIRISKIVANKLLDIARLRHDIKDQKLELALELLKESEDLFLSGHIDKSEAIMALALQNLVDFKK